MILTRPMNFVDERVSVGIEITRSDTDGGCDEVTVTLRRTVLYPSLVFDLEKTGLKLLVTTSEHG